MRGNKPFVPITKPLTVNKPVLNVELPGTLARLLPSHHVTLHSKSVSDLSAGPAYKTFVETDDATTPESHQPAPFDETTIR